ncbi:MBL fold metallo-hydrolase [Dactylosporangium sp. NPDC005572]|uniref:MBL fold metallo-hydrolase n=1 Tax=Dactylosporangium sp. NPDC005572 TaxID=3156889 RepID=UPI0033A0DDC9
MDVVTLHPQLVMLGFPVGQVYLWHGPDGLTLVDTGVPGSGPAIERVVAGLGYRRQDVRRVLLTHWHEDHAGSAAEVAGWGDVQVVAHRLDAPVIRGAAAGAPPVLAGWERRLWDEVHAQMADAAVPPAPVHREVDDGDELDLGGGVGAVCLAVPGHTPGSVAYHLPGPGILFTGDTVARAPDGTVMVGVFNADPEGTAASFRRLAGLGAAVTCFGHGQPLLGAG